MIGSIKGKVAELANEYCLIETPGGVGYRVFMTSDNLADLSLVSEVRVHTYTSVREDAILLFGFLQKQYYDLFVLLIAVSGVGPKVALGILSAVKPDDFYMAVQNRDMKARTKLPGIGKKTAERLLLELKDKISGGDEIIDTVFYPQGGDVPETAVCEAIEALQALGYTSSEIVPALKTVEGYEKMPCEEIIKHVLKVFAGRK